MKEETLEKLTIAEKYLLCRVINYKKDIGIIATLESLPFFKAEAVYQLVKEEAKKDPDLKNLENRLYNNS